VPGLEVADGDGRSGIKAVLLQPEEVRVPNLTSPANVDLPPGVYSMRAGVRSPAGQLALAQTKPLLPNDLADYEAAAQNFPETFERYFKP